MDRTDPLNGQSRSRVPHLAHWGSFEVETLDGQIAIRPHPADPDPSPILENIPAALRHPARVAQPFIRRGWLRNGPGPDEARGRDSYVAVDWDRALELAADELRRVRDEHGNQSIFGGSYGWSSAGRVHHAQSLAHRFLNTIGGYTSSLNSYSSGAATVILPRVFAPKPDLRAAVTWDAIVQHADLVVAFGGLASKNFAVAGGGPGRHLVRQQIEAACERGVRFILLSPLATDAPDIRGLDHLSIRPATDTALMLGIAHTLVTESLVHRDFVSRWCVGYEPFEAYLMGEEDGQPKSASWAAAITGLDVAAITGLARRMSAGRTLITVSNSLQRAQFGEQPVWMGVVLAAMLGQIGLAGGGYTYALGAFATVGMKPAAVPVPAMPQGRNPITQAIPVARIADMLLSPGSPYQYNGADCRYPEIRLVYWAGGNPFHHHQDLRRLQSAFTRPDTVIVHEPYWTATARRADIVFPSTITLEREDFGGAGDDIYLTAMHQVVEPYEQARNDYDTFAALAGRLGVAAEFTEGRTAHEWLRHLYGQLRERLAAAGIASPEFEVFWANGELVLPAREPGGWLRDFRADPDVAPLDTPSGKIEITSSTIGSFGYRDCPAHPVWLEPDEWLGSPRAREFPLQLVANQPEGRLHSQLDFGARSQELKLDGREVIRLNPNDANERGIEDGQVVLVFNDRGGCMAAARPSEGVCPGVVQLSTGAWYDPVRLPDFPYEVCSNGNPNAVTRDVGTSRLAQGSTGQLCLVEIRRYDGPTPSGEGYAPERCVGSSLGHEAWP